MDWKSLHRHGARLAPLTPLAILAAGCVVGAILLSSCRHERLTDEQLPPPGGAPEIHVCLTPAAVRSATISTTGGYHLSAGGRTVSRSSGPLRGMLIRRSGSSWQFGQIRAPGSAAELIASAGSCVRFAGTLYRGRLCLLPSGGDSFIVVNQLNLESYLAGVLPKELYPNWHGQTYRAQAIAARTYALYHIKTSGRSR
ncbi:MAG: SpoIID/LytB domain-containing protein, partial [Phycisphaerae bacterium]|nr:SpoIID/LytB domain-containing protein [Phycisphaerae bacterium]